MKLKGINPFEQHVEKFVVGGLAVLGLGVLSTQFLGSPNQIKVGSEEVAPERAYEPVKKSAEDLLSRVKSSTPTLPEAPKADVLARFEESLNRGVAPSPTLAGQFTPRANIGATNREFGPQGNVDFAEIAIPAPGAPIVRGSAGTIDPVEWTTNEGLRAYLPLQQPFDKFSVSVETLFDGAAFKQALTNDPDGPTGPLQPIPLGWVNNNVEILGVEVEREQIDPSGSAGTAAVTLKPLPGRSNMAELLATSLKSPGDMPRIVEQARQDREAILRPAFYDYIAGEKWTPPSELSEGGGLTERIDKAQKRLNEATDALENLRKKQAKASEPSKERRASGQESGERGKGPGGEASGRGQPGRQPAPKGGKEQPEKKTVKTTLETRIEKQETEVAGLTEQISKFKDELNGTKPKGADKFLPLMEDPKVRVWAHDLEVEAGATYRYRVRMIANNPLFGREASLKENQKSRAKQALVKGEWSEWSEPISVDQKVYYFVTSASERDNLGPARATAELMEFYYGFYRKASLPSANPGDVFMAEAKLPPDLLLYDLKKLAAGARPNLEQIAALPEGQEGGGRGRPAGGSKSGRGEVGGQPATPAGAATQPKNDLGKPGPEKLTISVDAMLLDVSTGPAPSASSIGKAATSRAFIRESLGKIVIRTPLEQHADDPVYQRVSRSAKLGENQGKPTVKERTPSGEVPAGNQPPPKKSHGDDGGGGGGGG